MTASNVTPMKYCNTFDRTNTIQLSHNVRTGRKLDSIEANFCKPHTLSHGRLAAVDGAAILWH